MKKSEIVAQAGRLGAVTIATNMAGRGRYYLEESEYMARLKMKEVLLPVLSNLRINNLDLFQSRQILLPAS